MLKTWRAFPAPPRTPSGFARSDCSLGIRRKSAEVGGSLENEVSIGIIDKEISMERGFSTLLEKKPLVDLLDGTTLRFPA